MNRRQALQSLFGATASAGVAVKSTQVVDVEDNRKPALIVLESDDWISMDQAERLVGSLERGLSGTALQGVKVVVLDRGMRFTVLDQAGRPMNHQLEA